MFGSIGLDGGWQGRGEGDVVPGLRPWAIGGVADRHVVLPVGFPSGTISRHCGGSSGLPGGDGVLGVGGAVVDVFTCIEVPSQ